MPPTGIRSDGGRKRSHQRAKGGGKWCPDGSALAFSDLSGGRQVVMPKRAPTAAVTAIASAPQKVTRRAPVAMGAPPAFAAIEPRDARKTSDTPATYGIRCFSGTRATAATRTAAPSANVMADVKACLLYTS